MRVTSATMSLREVCNTILTEKGFHFVIKDKQIEIVDTIFNGQDIFTVLPTGYGKTACYMLPPLLFDQLGTNSLLEKCDAKSELL